MSDVTLLVIFISFTFIINLIMTEVRTDKLQDQIYELKKRIKKLEEGPKEGESAEVTPEALRRNVGVVKISDVPPPEPVIKCRDCKYLMFSDMYGECSKNYMPSIVYPWDSCGKGKRRET